jgi:hypothetical protein
MSKCEWLYSKCDKESTSNYGYDNSPICDEHKVQWDDIQAFWAEQERKDREERDKNPWNRINTCTRCGLKMPEAWGAEDSARDRGVFQSTDGHNAEVFINGGYAEFIDCMDGAKQVAKLCHECGHELLKWLKYDFTQDNPVGNWVGHPKEPDDFCNGWSFSDYENKGDTND